MTRRHSRRSQPVALVLLRQWLSMCTTKLVDSAPWCLSDHSPLRSKVEDQGPGFGVLDGGSGDPGDVPTASGGVQKATS